MPDKGVGVRVPPPTPERVTTRENCDRPHPHLFSGVYNSVWTRLFSPSSPGESSFLDEMRGVCDQTVTVGTETLPVAGNVVGPISIYVVNVNLTGMGSTEATALAHAFLVYQTSALGRCSTFSHIPSPTGLATSVLPPVGGPDTSPDDVTILGVATVPDPHRAAHRAIGGALLFIHLIQSVTPLSHALTIGMDQCMTTPGRVLFCARVLPGV